MSHWTDSVDRTEDYLKTDDLLQRLFLAVYSRYHPDKLYGWLWIEAGIIESEVDEMIKRYVKGE